MKVLSGIAVCALLIAGAATPSFATSLSPGGFVTPGVTSATGFNTLANTGAIGFNFGGDTGVVQEIVANNYTGNTFGAGDISFFYQIQVTGGDVVNLTTESFAIPGLTVDVAQIGLSLDGTITAGSYTPAASASWTSDGTTLGFGFTPPNGLTPGDTSYTLIVNTNLTAFEGGVFSLQDGQTQNFAGYVPAATPEPSTLSLLGTGLLAAGAGLRRKMRRA